VAIDRSVSADAPPFPQVMNGNANMAEVRIEWLTDTHECETCGSSWAEGARVFVDGTEVLHLEPQAHCMGGAHWEQAAVYQEVFSKMGHQLTFND
jgi:hypothetical protein